MNPGTTDTKAEQTRRAIIDLLARGPALTADTLAERLDLSILYVRPRVSELVKRERIVANGDFGLNASGRMAKKWRVAQ
ncbi:winged helix-turn-helix transcriptional regulator [Dongia sp. agr-C8]